MVGMTLGAGMLVSGLAGAGASAYGAWRAGKTQSDALKQSRRDLERDRRERQAAWDSWQESQAPVFQTRQDALMAQLGRYKGPVGGSWKSPDETPQVVETMATLTDVDIPHPENEHRGSDRNAGWSSAAHAVAGSGLGQRAGKKKRKSRTRVGTPVIVEDSVYEVPGSLGGRMGQLYRG
jgi:hypothetical protein